MMFSFFLEAMLSVLSVVVNLDMEIGFIVMVATIRCAVDVLFNVMVATKSFAWIVPQHIHVANRKTAGNAEHK